MIQRLVVVGAVVLFAGCLVAVLFGPPPLKSWAGIVGAALIASGVVGLAAGSDDGRTAA
jgi:hypothetical protein